MRIKKYGARFWFKTNNRLQNIFLVLLEMSDSRLSSVSKRLRPNDAVDESWARDCLSDDEIDLPKDLMIEDHDEFDEEDEDENTPATAEEVWGDLGLDNFLQDLNILNANANTFLPGAAFMPSGTTPSGTAGSSSATSVAAGEETPATS